MKNNKRYRWLIFIEIFIAVFSVLFPIGIGSYYYIRKYVRGEHYPLWYGDISNWSQAFISVFTLLAVIYTARKTSIIAESSNGISKDSAVIAERSTLVQIIHNLVSDANNVYRNHVSSIERCETLPIITPLTPQREKEAILAAHRSLFSGLTEEQSIIKYIVCLERAVSVGKNAIYNGQPSQIFYINVLSTYLDLSLREELFNRKILNKTLTRLKKNDITVEDTEFSIIESYYDLAGVGF